MLNSRLLFCLLLALPSIPLLLDFINEQRYYAELMYDSGVFSAQLLVLSLAVTPLSLFARSRPKWQSVARWWIRRRRYIGVASFGYAAIHLAVYIRETHEWFTILNQAKEWEYLSGWAAFLTLVILAATSNNRPVLYLKQRWKLIHRFTYGAVVLIALHWVLFEIFLDTFAYLVLVAITLFAYRLIENKLDRSLPNA